MFCNAENFNRTFAQPLFSSQSLLSINKGTHTARHDNNNDNGKRRKMQIKKRSTRDNDVAGMTVLAETTEKLNSKNNKNRRW